MADLLTEVIKYKKYLDKYTDKAGEPRKLCHVLKNLGKLPITLEHLKQTGVGKTVNSFRKYEDPVGDKARELVAKWKALVHSSKPSSVTTETVSETHYGEIEKISPKKHAKYHSPVRRYDSHDSEEDTDRRSEAGSTRSSHVSSRRSSVQSESRRSQHSMSDSEDEAERWREKHRREKHKQESQRRDEKKKRRREESSSEEEEVDADEFNRIDAFLGSGSESEGEKEAINEFEVGESSDDDFYAQRKNKHRNDNNKHRHRSDQKTKQDHNKHEHNNDKEREISHSKHRYKEKYEDDKNSDRAKNHHSSDKEKLSHKSDRSSQHSDRHENRTSKDRILDEHRKEKSRHSSKERTTESSRHSKEGEIRKHKSSKERDHTSTMHNKSKLSHSFSNGSSNMEQVLIDKDKAKSLLAGAVVSSDSQAQNGMSPTYIEKGSSASKQKLVSSGERSDKQSGHSSSSGHKPDQKSSAFGTNSSLSHKSSSSHKSADSHRSIDHKSSSSGSRSSSSNCKSSSSESRSSSHKSSHDKQKLSSSEHKSSNHKSTDHKGSHSSSRTSADSKSSSSSKHKDSSSSRSSSKHHSSSSKSSSSSDHHSRSENSSSSKTKSSSGSEKPKSSSRDKSSSKATVIKSDSKKAAVSFDLFDTANQSNMGASSDSDDNGMSFDDMMVMGLKATTKKRKVHHKSSSSSASKSSSNTSRSSHHGQKDSARSKSSGHSNSKTSSSDKGEKRKAEDIAIPAPPTKQVKLSENDIMASLPEITTNYKPLPYLKPEEKRGSHEVMVNVTTSKKGFQQSVYSGRKQVFLTAVPRLFDACMRVLKDNVDSLEYVGGVPYDILKPVLETCSPTQLYGIEEFNEHFISEDDELWEKHCKKDFRSKTPDEFETWRELYLRLHDERDARLQRLSNQIAATSKARNDPVKKTKLAYVEGPAKAPRNVMRQQKKFGTAGPSKADPLRRLTSHGGRDMTSSQRAPRYGSTHNSNQPRLGDSLRRKKNDKAAKMVAPMMAKVRNMLKIRR